MRAARVLVVLLLFAAALVAGLPALTRILERRGPTGEPPPPVESGPATTGSGVPSPQSASSAPPPGPTPRLRPGGPRVQLTPTSVHRGERLTATFEGIEEARETDWISLYRAGDPDTKYGEWSYLRGVAAGTVAFTAPGAPGQYEARLFLDWPRGQYVVAARSAPVYVEAPPLEVEGRAGAGVMPRLTLERRTYAPGDPVTVRFSAPHYADDAWIGIIPSEIAHGREAVNDQHDVSYQYLRGRTAGEMVFKAPRPGRWDLRLHSTDAGGDETASVSFVVSATTLALAGTWRDEAGDTCHLLQEGDEVWWLCDAPRGGAPGRVGHGTISGSALTLRVVRLRARSAPSTREVERGGGEVATSLLLTAESRDVLREEGVEAAGVRRWRRQPGR